MVNSKPRLRSRPARKGAEPSALPSRESLLRMLYYMKLTRTLETKIEQKLYRQGKIVGGVYVGRGQEAIGVASAIQLEENDVVCPSHRDMGVYLIRGFPLKYILAQYMARATGPTKGKDGNMHMGDMNYNTVAFVSMLGNNVAVGAGIALAFKMRKEPRVAVAYFGEGATSTGVFHEAVNFASVQHVPLVLICNNNAYAYSTSTDKQYAIKNIAERGESYDVPWEVIDGNDTVAVYEAARRAIEHARKGGGPTFIECKTFRMTGHAAHDDAGYVPKELFEEWARKDPLLRLEALLKGQGVIDDKGIQELQARIESEVDTAAEEAEKEPLPEPLECLKGVYADDSIVGQIPEWRQEAMREGLAQREYAEYSTGDKEAPSSE